MTPIKYIGKRPNHKDTLYRTGLIFQPGQQHHVPDEVALKMLAHADVYVRGAGSVKIAPEKEVLPPTPDEEELAQDVTDQINAMDKDGLRAFAKTYFNADLDARRSANSLRQEVLIMANRFGVPR